MTPQNELTEETRERFTKVRNALLKLHKTLLDYERDAYERTKGPIGNSYAFLELVMNDPWFGWLRLLSALIVQMDALLASKEAIAETEAIALMEESNLLLKPSESGSEFQRKYFAAMQLSPEVVLAHSDFANAFGPGRLSKEVH
jgi:hypothetical protein